MPSGQVSGFAFHNEFLSKHFDDPKLSYKIIIHLDGTYGYPLGFLQAAFGTLGKRFGAQRVLERLEFVSYEEPSLVERIQEIIKNKSKDFS